MDTDKRKKLEEIIWSLETREDLDEAGRIIRQKWDHLVKQTATSFQPGDQVRWRHEGRTRTGHVAKCNVKTVDVHEDGSDKAWRITATELEHV